MMTKLHAHKGYVLALLLIALFCGQFSTIPTAQASTHAGPQKIAGCQTTVRAGWRPYRMQAGDTLSTLAAQAKISVTELMNVNCLTGDALSADTLVLAPVIGTPKLNGVLAAPVPAVAPATGAVALLTVISTTTTMSTSRAATAAMATAANPLGWPTMSWLTFLALGIVGLATVFVGFAPQQPSASPARRWLGLWSNLLFLGIGMFIGMVFFPELRMPALSALPAGVSAPVTVALIGLLAAKELFFKGQQWRTLNRMLNVGLVPLLALFFLTVATRVAETIN